MIPTVTPRPPRATAPDSTPTVRRCTAARSTVGGGSGHPGSVPDDAAGADGVPARRTGGGPGEGSRRPTTHRAASRRGAAARPDCLRRAAPRAGRRRVSGRPGRRRPRRQPPDRRRPRRPPLRRRRPAPTGPWPGCPSTSGSGQLLMVGVPVGDPVAGAAPLAGVPVGGLFLHGRSRRRARPSAPQWRSCRRPPRSPCRSPSTRRAAGADADRARLRPIPSALEQGRQDAAALQAATAGWAGAAARRRVTMDLGAGRRHRAGRHRGRQPADRRVRPAVRQRPAAGGRGGDDRGRGRCRTAACSPR